MTSKPVLIAVVLVIADLRKLGRLQAMTTCAYTGLVLNLSGRA